MEKQTATDLLVVTFTCNNNVHVYEEKSGTQPMYPYNVHSTIKTAVKYLKEKRKINKPKIIVYE
jgi:hypothetical protein